MCLVFYFVLISLFSYLLKKKEEKMKKIRKPTKSSRGRRAGKDGSNWERDEK
jgi:hypothetical protein